MNFIDKDFGLRIICENSHQVIYTIDKDNSSGVYQAQLRKNEICYASPGI